MGPVVWNLSGICSGIIIFMLRFCKILNLVFTSCWCGITAAALVKSEF